MKSVYWCKLIVKTSQFSLKDKQNTTRITRRYWRKEKFAKKEYEKETFSDLGKGKKINNR